MNACCKVQFSQLTDLGVGMLNSVVQADVPLGRYELFSYGEDISLRDALLKGNCILSKDKARQKHCDGFLKKVHEEFYFLFTWQDP